LEITQQSTTSVAYGILVLEKLAKPKYIWQALFSRQGPIWSIYSNKPKIFLFQKSFVIRKLYFLLYSSNANLEAPMAVDLPLWHLILP
jgi:hypothetical protein